MTLLYDKTFPPRPSTAKLSLKNAFPRGDDTTHNFTYYGQVQQEVDDIEDADVEKLEKEIEEVLRKREGSSGKGIVNIGRSGGGKSVGRRREE